MIKQIDVSDIPQPLIDAIESILRSHRQSMATVSQNSTSSERPIGWLKGKFEVPESFFDPLPDDLLNLFEGNEPESDR